MKWLNQIVFIQLVINKIQGDLKEYDIDSHGKEYNTLIKNIAQKSFQGSQNIIMNIMDMLNTIIRLIVHAVSIPFRML